MPSERKMLKFLLPLLAALAVTLLAYFLGPWHGSGVSFSPARSAAPPTGTRVVAIQTIPPGTVITPAMVTLQPVQRSGIPPQDLTGLGQAVGQVSQVELTAGEVLREEDVEPTAIGNLVYQVPAGKRAMTISVTDTSGVDYRLLTNERVDVMVVTGGTGSANASIILTGLRVLALGPPSPATAQTSLGTGSATNYATVTLSVTAAQAATLAQAESQGSIILLARRIGHNGRARLEYPSGGNGNG